MKARRVTGMVEKLFGTDEQYAQAYRESEPGDFEIITDEKGQRYFWFKCPGPCKSIAPLMIRPVQEGHPERPSWELTGIVINGQIEEPTLYPSINHVGCWHGWLSNGVFHL